jgi:nicotinate-nucleotide adenylyltransferase
MARPVHEAPPLSWIAPPGPIGTHLTIGLLGGSFNPAHEGHLYVSETARKALGLSAVWWLVTPGNPLKRASDLAELNFRTTVARRLAGSRAIVTDIESRLGTRFTVDTARALKRRFPGTRFVWLMGSDNLARFGRWKNWAELARLVPIVVVRRPGTALDTLKSPLIRRFGQARRLGAAPSVLLLDGPRNTQSSTIIRAGLEPRLMA